MVLEKDRHEYVADFIYGQMCSHEEYNDLRYDENGQEYTVEIVVRRGKKALLEVDLPEHPR